MSDVFNRIGGMLAKGVRYWADVFTGRAAASAPGAGTRTDARNPAGKYQVLVDDNFDYMDESKRWEQGRYDTLEEAMAVCKRMVDDFLQDAYRPGMSAEELERAYRMFGDDPFIPGVDRETFSAWTYASGRAREMCTGAP
jgi:hypothetical protein